MAFQIRRAQYFYCSIEDQPGEAYKVLSELARLGVNLVAITAVPVGPTRTQLTLFPEDSARLAEAARNARLELDGPQPAFIVQGDDELGALASVHQRLFEANVNVYASSGVSDGKGDYGYVIYVRPDDYDRAAVALEL